jgi:P27 family predicted phage terminase small subunit
MRRGPAPKPTRLKLLAGNPGRRRLNDTEPQPKLAARLVPPVELDDFGLKFWRYHATLLKHCRVLSEADVHALAAAAQWWSVYQRAMNDLGGKLTQSSVANGEVAKPAVTIARQAFSLCWSVMQAFGLNPGDRSKLRAMPPDPEDDPTEKYFAKRFLA